MTLRRPFERSLVTAVLVLALSAVGGPVTAQQGFQTTEVAPGLYSFGNGGVYNAFMVTDDGVIVMDSVNEGFATASLAAIREVKRCAGQYHLEVRVLDDRELECLPELFLPGMLLELTPQAG